MFVPYSPLSTLPKLPQERNIRKMAASVSLLQLNLKNSLVLFVNNTKLVPCSCSSSLSIKKSSIWRNNQQRSLKPNNKKVFFALTESDSPKSLEPDSDEIQSLLRQLVESFDLPQDYFSQLPGDLRLDLNDAAFDLSNGPVLDQCGQELGETLLNLSRAWELADALTSYTLVSKFPSLEKSLTNNAKSAFGKRLVSAGRRFKAMGQYGGGELQKIAEVMITTGRYLSVTSISTETDEELKTESRMFKFGELQVEITSSKANIGAAIAFVFGILSWQIAQGIQNIPESSLEYANDNALLLAKSLRGAILALFYSSAVLSGFTSVGLILLARQLKSKEE